MDKGFKSAYIDGPARLMAALTEVKVRCPSCTGNGHLGQEECSVCHGEGSIPREMATYEAQAKGDY